MRRPARRQSALRAPLNHILGSEANVRILRVITSAVAPLGKTEVARRARLNASGVRRALSQLADLGLVECLGTGSQRLVRLRREHPLAAALVGLFAAERARFERVIEALRSVVRRFRPPPRAAWIQGPVARESDESGDPIVVGVLAAAGELERMVEQLNTQLYALEREHDVTIATVGWTSADLATLPEDELVDLEDAVPLLGPPPSALISEAGATPTRLTGARTHDDLDRRALALARVVADRLAQDASLIERAREHIARRLERASSGEQKELHEWDQLLSAMTPARLRKFLVDPGERATRLRQTLPFLDVVSQEEREAILAEAGS